MNGTLRNCRLATVALLVVCAVPPCAAAQEFVCWPIARGETAPRLAHRLTGNPNSAYTDAFQIRDPARRMFVPKSQYRNLKAGWQACVANTSRKSSPAVFAPEATPVASSIVPKEPAITSAPLTRTAERLTLAWARWPSDGVLAGWIAASFLLIVICTAVAVVLAPHPVPPPLQRAGDAFVNAFARPLIDLGDPGSNGPPIQTRLRFVRRKQQLEISIAPGPGRRYPNLVDHKRNVEYDVGRVMRLLGHRLVVSDRLRAAGKWVVVPIRLADAKQTGVK
jgi:hypothetical protein